MKDKIKKVETKKTPNGQKGSIKKVEDKAVKKIEVKDKSLKEQTGKMEFKREDIESALKLAQNFIEKKGSLPILSHVHFRAGKDNIKIEATDLVKSWNKTLSIKGDSISRCIPFDILTREIKALSPDIKTISLKFNPNSVQVNGRCEIFTLPSTEFPAIKDFEGSKVEVEGLGEKLKRVIPAAGKEDTRYILNGVLIDLEKGHVVATDGHRLHYENIKAVKGVGKIVIPLDSACLIAKYAALIVTMKIDKSFVSLTMDGGKMTSSLLEGNYPDYNELLSKQTDMTVTYKGSDFLRVLEGALPLTTKGNGITLTIDGQIEIKSQNPDLGHYEWHIPCESNCNDKKEFVIGFNAGYLIDAIRAYTMKDDKVIMGFGDSLSPCRINTKAVVMPVRV